MRIIEWKWCSPNGDELNFKAAPFSVHVLYTRKSRSNFRISSHFSFVLATLLAIFNSFQFSLFYRSFVDVSRRAYVPQKFIVVRTIIFQLIPIAFGLRFDCLIMHAPTVPSSFAFDRKWPSIARREAFFSYSLLTPVDEAYEKKKLI